MQVRRGYSDSPRKRKARADAVMRQTNLFGAGRAAMTTDDDVRRCEVSAVGRVVRVDTTEDEVHVRRGVRELQATRGWRSDDALFAVPMVRRYPSAAAHSVTVGSRKSSVVTGTVVSSATASDAEHGQTMDRSVYEGIRPISRRPSEKAHATVNGLLSPTEPSIGYFTAPAPCPPAVDDTPALASGASVLPSTPVDQLLHEKLAGTPSRRRGSDAVTHGRPEGSGSDGYRSRASSAMGFRSDEPHAGQHRRDSASYINQHTPQQQQTTIIESQDGQEEGHVAPRTPRMDSGQRLPSAGILLSPSGQTAKSKPIKCPSPRRRQDNEVRI